MIGCFGKLSRELGIWGGLQGKWVDGWMELRRTGGDW